MGIYRCRKLGDKPSNVYMYDNAYYDKGRSSGVCIALAATIVYTLDIIVWVGYDRACLLLTEYEHEYDVEVVWRIGHRGWTMLQAGLDRLELVP